MRAVVTVIGKDKVGIIAAISTELANSNINILDITQTTMQNVFTMIMLIDISQINISFNELKQKLDETGKRIGLSVRVQRVDIFDSMHKI